MNKCKLCNKIPAQKINTIYLCNDCNKKYSISCTTVIEARKVEMDAINIKNGILSRDTDGFISFLKWLRDEYNEYTNETSEGIDIIEVVEKPWHWHSEWNQYQGTLI